MYALPASTLVSKQLPKTNLCQMLAFKPQECRQVDNDVSRIDIVAQLTPQTHRRNELYAQLQQLNKQINELQ